MSLTRIGAWVCWLIGAVGIIACVFTRDDIEGLMAVWFATAGATLTVRAWFVQLLAERRELFATLRSPRLNSGR